MVRVGRSQDLCHVRSVCAAAYLGGRSSPQLPKQINKPSLCPRLMVLPVFCPSSNPPFSRQITAHLGDFPHRLSQYCRAEYEFTPIPPISYPQLRDEMWCHRYYLRNLCDEVRFPDWPIVEHVEFLQSMLAMWRDEVAQKELDLSDEEACSVLELNKGEYRSVASAV